VDPQTETFVLAGGRSSRMGQDKARLQVDGRSLVEIALDKLRGLSAIAPRIAGGSAELSSYAPVVPDMHPGCGPLSGIEAALAATSQPLNVFLPVDVPRLPAPFLAWMLRRAGSTGALVTVPRFNGLAQPLCAVYHQNLLGGVSASLAAGNYKVMAVVTAAALRLTSSEAIDVFDVELLSSTDAEFLSFSSLPLYRWFHNCNTPEDINALVLSE
jgi:molybdenum cofactor guanylyltransferase